MFYKWFHYTEMAPNLLTRECGVRFKGLAIVVSVPRRFIRGLESLNQCYHMMGFPKQSSVHSFSGLSFVVDQETSRRPSQKPREQRETG